MTRAQLLTRIPVLLYVGATLWLNAAIVQRLNLNAGGWVLLLGLLNATLVLAGAAAFGRRRILYHAILLASTLALFAHVDRGSTWRATCEVRAHGDTFILADESRYYAPTTAPNRFPFAMVNDVWAIRDTAGAACKITWIGLSDTVSTEAELGALFVPRNVVPALYHPTSSAWIIIAALLLIGLMTFADIARHFFRGMTWSWETLTASRSAAIFFLAGVLVGSFKLHPTAWLSNEFLSRPDDWLCYEKGARQILAGNVFLIPAPGGVEMWSPLFTYVVAALHFLFGPAMGVIHIIMHGLHYVLIWAMLALLSMRHRWLVLAVAPGTLLFVEVDLNLHYAWHLLSDTLPLLLFTVLILAWERGRDLRVLGALCGLLYLARLELLWIGPLLLAVHYAYDHASISRRQMAGFSLAFLACVIPYLVRRHALFNDMLPLPLGMGESGHLHWRALLSTDHLLMKAKALFGRYDLLNPDLQFRFHWMPVHALFLVAVAHSIARRRTDRYIVFAISSWVCVLFTRMVSPSIGIYGHRHSLLLILIEMIVIVLVAGRLADRRTLNAPAP